MVENQICSVPLIPKLQYELPFIAQLIFLKNLVNL